MIRAPFDTHGERTPQPNYRRSTMSRTRTRRLTTAAVAIAAGAVPLAGAASASAATAPAIGLGSLTGALSNGALADQASGIGSDLAGSIPVAASALPAQHIGDTSSASGVTNLGTANQLVRKAGTTMAGMQFPPAVPDSQLSDVPLVGPLAQQALGGVTGAQALQQRDALPAATGLGSLTSALPVGSLPVSNLPVDGTSLGSVTSSSPLSSLTSQSSPLSSVTQGVGGSGGGVLGGGSLGGATGLVGGVAGGGL
jgi:hypothetical protein